MSEDKNSGSEAGATQDSAAVADEAVTRIVADAGPNPEVWGDDEERPAPGGLAGASLGAAPGEVVNEGTEDEIVGPNPEGWSDEARRERDGLEA